MLGYLYGKAVGEPVTLHLTREHVVSGNPDVDKQQSWKDIIDLFPDLSVSIQSHQIRGGSNEEWVQYLQNKGVNAECYYYGDTFGMYRYDEKFGFDIAPYLTKNPMLEPIVGSAYELPDGPYATMQWDAGSADHCERRMPKVKREKILCHYAKLGLKMITVGGESDDPLLRTSVKHVGYVMANAKLHVGVASGPMFVANLYLPPERIHLYTMRERSHHTVRWLANGVVQKHP
jgi:hypothetical protein